MSFMEHEITGKQLWYVIDGNRGIDYMPAEYVNFLKSVPMGRSIDDSYPRLFAALCKAVRDYTENTYIDTIEVIAGYGARLSAPGYMDCTEWSIFNTPEEAQAYLNEHYPNDDEDDTDESN